MLTIPFHFITKQLSYIVFSFFFSDLIDDNSQTATIGHTTDHSRTPSPQKAIFTTTTKPNTTSSAVTNAQSPVHTSSPYTPPPSATTKNIPAQQTSIPSSNISVPKPFRSTTSIAPDTQNNHESVSILFLFPEKILLSSHETRI